MKKNGKKQKAVASTRNTLSFVLYSFCIGYSIFMVLIFEVNFKINFIK